MRLPLKTMVCLAGFVLSFSASVAAGHSLQEMQRASLETFLNKLRDREFEGQAHFYTGDGQFVSSALSQFNTSEQGSELSLQSMFQDSEGTSVDVVEFELASETHSLDLSSSLKDFGAHFELIQLSDDTLEYVISHPRESQNRMRTLWRAIGGSGTELHRYDFSYLGSKLITVRQAQLWLVQGARK